MDFPGNFGLEKLFISCTPIFETETMFRGSVCRLLFCFTASAMGSSKDTRVKREIGRQGCFFCMNTLSKFEDKCLCLSCLVLSCLVLSCLVLSCLVLFCLVLSCLVLSCLVLSCLVLSCRPVAHGTPVGLGDRVVKYHPMVPTAWPLNRAWTHRRNSTTMHHMVRELPRVPMRLILKYHKGSCI